MLQKLYNNLDSLKNPWKAKILQGFFKTWPWQYWEWDIFLWITVPELKSVAKKYLKLSFWDIETLLHSKIHDHRYVWLTIIRFLYEKSKDEIQKETLFQLSLKNISSINNWDLVDSFIPYVWGEYFFTRNRELLYTLVYSKNLWERRIAIMTTFYFLRQKDFKDTIQISQILLHDTHDLIHKATGWMLREIWKRDLIPLYSFLDSYHKTMPRTMLRYSLEKLDTKTKAHYMKK